MIGREEVTGTAKEGSVKAPLQAVGVYMARFVRVYHLVKTQENRREMVRTLVSSLFVLAACTAFVSVGYTTRRLNTGFVGAQESQTSTQAGATTDPDVTNVARKVQQDLALLEAGVLGAVLVLIQREQMDQEDRKVFPQLHLGLR